MSNDGLGICPSCEAVGGVGEPCVQRACARRGYHFIPGDYAPVEGEEPDPSLGKKVADYLIVDLVGSGGFGQVFLALQMPVRLKAALKLLDLRQVPPQMVGVVNEKFAGEANALAALHHPHVVRLLQYGDFDGKPFLVMEYLPDGVTLGEATRQRIAAGRSFALTEFREIFSQLLDGITAVHAAGIIHRDLKPDNLMLQTVEGSPVHLRLLDFGLAKFIDYGDTTRHTLGTPQYMAPEQFTNANIGPWTDLYAIGVMAYELLTGTCPFGNDSYHKILQRKMDLTYNRDRIFAEAGLPPPLESVLRGALGRYPADRYGSATELKTALFEALAAIEMQPQWAELPALTRLLDPDELKDMTASVREMPAPAPPSASSPVKSDEAYQKFLLRERSRLETEARRLAEIRERRAGSRALPRPGDGARGPGGNND